MVGPVDVAKQRAEEALGAGSLGRFWFAVTNDVTRLRQPDVETESVVVYETAIHAAAREIYVELSRSFEGRRGYHRPLGVDQQTLPHVGPYLVCLVRTA